jgi:hypothetical protein
MRDVWIEREGIFVRSMREIVYIAKSDRKKRSQRSCFIFFGRNRCCTNPTEDVGSGQANWRLVVNSRSELNGGRGSRQPFGLTAKTLPARQWVAQPFRRKVLRNNLRSLAPQLEIMES